MRALIFTAIAAASIGFQTVGSQAQGVSCREVYQACQRWCYATRGGPEMFLCKNNCQTEFNSSLNSGVFQREDGRAIECLAVPHVVQRSEPRWSLPKRRL